MFDRKALLTIVCLLGVVELLYQVTWRSSLYPAVKKRLQLNLYADNWLREIPEIQTEKKSSVSDVTTKVKNKKPDEEHTTQLIIRKKVHTASSKVLAKTTTNRQPDCPISPIVVLDYQGGRLGNQIWGYAALRSLSWLTGRAGYVPDNLLTPLKNVFVKLSLRSTEEIKHCNLEFDYVNQTNRLLPLKNLNETFKGRHILLASWTLCPTLISNYFNETKNELRFKPEILRDVEDTIERVGGKGRTRVGIHVRRTDYAEFLKRDYKTPLVGKIYFQDAIKWFRTKITGPLIFLILSDDLVWCRTNLLDAKVKDVVIASKYPAHDLALLATSAHNIIDYGTFGTWGAFVAGGHTFALDPDIKSVHEEMMSLTDKWHVYDINKQSGNETVDQKLVKKTKK